MAVNRVAGDLELGLGVVVLVRLGVIHRDEHGMPWPDENDDFQIQYFDAPQVTAEQIEEHGLAPESGHGWPNFTARLGNLNFVLHRNGERFYPTRRLGGPGWFFECQPLVHEYLVEEGWPFGEERWVDIPVEVDSDHVVRVVKPTRERGS